MVSEDIQIYIRAMEGSDPFHAPVPCKRLANSSYEILPDGEGGIFDDEDESQLYEFGPGDIVTAEMMEFYLVPELVALKLLHSGSKVNDLKRLMFVILADNPNPSLLINQLGKNTVRLLLTESEKIETCIYPGIRQYVEEHRRILEEAL